jgi:hypothetical protein
MSFQHLESLEIGSIDYRNARNDSIQIEPYKCIKLYPFTVLKKLIMAPVGGPNYTTWRSHIEIDGLKHIGPMSNIPTSISFLLLSYVQ